MTKDAKQRFRENVFDPCLEQCESFSTLSKLVIITVERHHLLFIILSVPGAVGKSRKLVCILHCGEKPSFTGRSDPQ